MCGTFAAHTENPAAASLQMQAAGCLYLHQSLDIYDLCNLTLVMKPFRMNLRELGRIGVECRSTPIYLYIAVTSFPSEGVSPDSFEETFRAIS